MFDYDWMMIYPRTLAMNLVRRAVAPSLWGVMAVMALHRRLALLSNSSTHTTLHHQGASWSSWTQWRYFRMALLPAMIMVFPVIMMTLPVMMLLPAYVDGDDNVSDGDVDYCGDIDFTWSKVGTSYMWIYHMACVYIPSTTECWQTLYALWRVQHLMLSTPLEGMKRLDAATEFVWWCQALAPFRIKLFKNNSKQNKLNY